MTWEMIGTLIAFLSVVLGYITWFEKRRDKKALKTKEQKEIERTELIEDVCDVMRPEMKNCMQNELSPYETKKDSEKAHAEILKGLKEIKDDINVSNLKLNEAMIERIQGEIISFAEGMKHGIKPSSVAYEHIYDSYRKYKALGGNGFIDNMFKWIEKARERGENDEDNQ